MGYGIEPLSNQDLALLSAYLDGQLNEIEHQQLEKRLVDEPSLQAELQDLQEVVELVRSLPRLKAPRDFRLDPAKYRTKTDSAKITRLNTWRLSSIAGLAATILFVMAGSLIVGNPLADGTHNDESSDVGQVAFTKTESQQSANEAVEGAVLREDQTAMALLPTETDDIQQTEFFDEPDLTLTFEAGRTFSLDDSSGADGNANEPDMSDVARDISPEPALSYDDSSDGDDPEGIFEQDDVMDNDDVAAGAPFPASGGASGGGDSNSVGGEAPPPAPSFVPPMSPTQASNTQQNDTMPSASAMGDTIGASIDEAEVSEDMADSDGFFGDGDLANTADAASSDMPADASEEMAGDEAEKIPSENRLMDGILKMPPIQFVIILLNLILSILSS